MTEESLGAASSSVEAARVDSTLHDSSHSVNLACKLLNTRQVLTQEDFCRFAVAVAADIDFKRPWMMSEP